VLFLDVEGVFPNAVPARLIHNLCKRWIPHRYTKFITGMLEGRVTSLKFNDQVSDAINIDNRIRQGDPLSMVLYQYYNADILDVPDLKHEAAITAFEQAQHPSATMYEPVDAKYSPKQP